MADGGTPKTGASFSRGTSKQDYRTPEDLLEAVRARFGDIEFDLAASAENAVAESFYTEADDALRCGWPPTTTGVLWLNPPFGNIAPWASRCRHSAAPHRRILLLVPASVGSEWFSEHVHGHAMVFALRPRPSFDGKNPFPKDVMLCAYGFGVTGFDTWRWK